MNDTYTVVSTMKNEGPYILEWVAHHRALGFDQILVQTNDCSDNTDRLLSRLAEVTGYVSHYKTRVGRGGIHRSALRQASRRPAVVDAKWVYVCDVDEFLDVKVGDGTIQALLKASQPEPGVEPHVIHVPWRIFGPNGVHHFANAPVTQQFTRAEAPDRPGAGKFVKSVFRELPRFKRMGLHYPVRKPDDETHMHVVRPGGAAVANSAVSYDIAQVNHYALRSMEAFLIKRDRGRANHMSHVLGIDYWDRFDHSDVEDTGIRRYDHAVEQEMDAYLADPTIARLHRKSVRWHRMRAGVLQRDPAFAALRDAILERMPLEASSD